MVTAGLSFAAEPASPYAEEEANEEHQLAKQMFFGDAMPLIKKGRCAEALPILARSLRLYRSPFTLLTQAECLSKVGRYLEAREVAQEAEALAKEELKKSTGRRAAAKQEVARDAATLAAAADKALCRVTLMVPTALRDQSPNIHYQQLRNEGEAEAERTLSNEQYDRPVEVDPGHYRVSVDAAGLRSWSSEVHLPTSGDHIAMVLPELAGAAPVDAGLPPLRVAAVALAIPGFVSVLAGAVMGLTTLSFEVAPATDLEKLRDYTAVAGGLTGVGAALATAGAAMWLLGEPSQAAPVTVGVGPTSVTLNVQF